MIGTRDEKSTLKPRPQSRGVIRGRVVIKCRGYSDIWPGSGR